MTYIPFNGIRKREIVIDNLLWNTYRSIKKVIRIPGKPHVLHRKNVVTDSDVIKIVQKSVKQNQPLENWPLKKYVSLIYDNGVVYGHNDMIYKGTNWVYDKKINLSLRRQANSPLPPHVDQQISVGEWTPLPLWLSA